jgi:hypothetical protein
MVYDAVSTHRSGVLSMESFKRAMQPLSVSYENAAPVRTEDDSPFAMVE